MEFYAHTSKDGNELLSDHLIKTAELSKQYAAEFDNEKIGFQIGILHDVGKFTEKFQNVLKHKETKIDHAIVGAIIYFNHGNIESKFMKRIISGIIAAHHSYLRCNKNEYNEIENYENPIELYTNDNSKRNAVTNKKEYEEILNRVIKAGFIKKITKEDYFCTDISKNKKEFYTRMLMSCLVDADYTMTAEFSNSNYDGYGKKQLDASGLICNLTKYRNEIINKSNPKVLMNRLRNKVYENCTRVGKCDSDGVYTLTAPTGTAKTLALLSFALEKAKVMNKKRIFIVLPYLSIISQNAQIYREICGENIVLEDDSITDITDNTREYADRWNMPIIITTSVKFFNTIFEYKATNLRKLHNISNSVVVFDECQTLPSNVLDSTLEIMCELPKKYHTSVLFSTATLPKYQYRKNIGNDWNPIEVIDDVDELFKQYEIAKNTIKIYDTDNEYGSKELVDRFKDSKQVLFVFNTVKKAEDMYDYLIREYSENECFILSSNMCSAHKMHTIKIIKERLEKGDSCYVASTQCIEAGVDLDFPCGAREYAPYDSEIQTAGRINRNGKYSGRILFFKHKNSSLYDYPSAYYKNASQLSFNMAKSNLENSEIKKMDKYFKDLYRNSVSECEEDKEELKIAIEEQNFKAIKDNYQIISDTNSVNVIVPYKDKIEEYEEIVNNIRELGGVITKKIMKESMSIKVSTHKKGDVEKCCERLYLKNKNVKEYTNWYILNDYGLYSKKGLMLDKGGESFCL